MINIEIPSYKNLKIDSIVFDYNGTLALDGKLISGVKDRLREISRLLNVYIVTADTYGTVRDNFSGSNVEIVIISQENGTEDKTRFIEKIGAENTIAVGNGNNDSMMLKKSALGIGILGNEGMAKETLLNCDMVIKDINDVFDMVGNTKRIVATMRK